MSKTRQSPRHMTAGYAATFAIAISAIAVISGCGSGAATPSSPTTTGSNATPSNHPTNATVRLQNIAIHPSLVTIQQGSTVTWQWLDGHIDTSHNVTSLPGGPQFKASGTRQSGSYSIRFTKPGKYLYECTLHPASMQGEIVVE
jgi:plastocyanin